MKKRTLLNMGGIILFYFLIVLGVILLNLRFKYINNEFPKDTYVSWLIAKVNSRLNK